MSWTSGTFIYLLQPALDNGFSRFELGAKASRPQNSRRLPTALGGLGEQDWETTFTRTEAGSPSFDRIAFETKTGSSLAPGHWYYH